MEGARTSDVAALLHSFPLCNPTVLQACWSQRWYLGACAMTTKLLGTEFPKGPFRTTNATTIAKIVNYYVVVFLLPPPDLLRHGPFSERENVCNSQENGVCTRRAAIANHRAIVKTLRVVNLLRVVFLVRRGPLGRALSKFYRCGASEEKQRFWTIFLSAPCPPPRTRVKWVPFVLLAFFPQFYSIFRFKIGHFPFKNVVFWELEKAICGPEKDKWWIWGSKTPQPPEMPIKRHSTTIGLATWFGLKLGQKLL